MEEIEYPDWTIERRCILQELEKTAKDYIHYFTYQARDYQPMVVIWSRDELGYFGRLGCAGVARGTGRPQHRSFIA
ncbi:hypothetical protein NIES37_67200 [Tolypothrix tenuis PCC 7101]|uniref:Uncharacterized protein n=1 Tax=Tolypothrix tenuis PCC 7101 TaxID=231146 RepID=A0A1Z4NAE2_9CYAN|nr:hypothetical protein NIES37_67200 [Tolypothrix tenuis PCC 7101]BAZ78400.1 hypothetical protein NIES50_70330 [Aulosira laxa NIES-50]